MSGKTIAIRILGTIVAIGVVVGLVLAGKAFIDYQVELTEAERVSQDAHSPHSVIVGVDLGGNTLSGGSRIPVLVRGTDFEGAAVDRVYYVGEDGRGIDLVQGDYTLSVPAPPLLESGAFLTAPSATYDLQIGSDIGTHESIDIASSYVLSFDETDIHSVTDAQIESAYKYASEGGCDPSNAARLRDIVFAARDGAVLEIEESKTAAERQKREEQAAKAKAEQDAKYHVKADGFEFDLPEYWRDRVTVQNEGSTVRLVSTQYPECTVATLQKKSANEPLNAGDTANANIHQINLADGSRLELWVVRYTYLTADDWARLEHQPSKRAYDDEKANNLVVLCTGDRYNFSDMKEAIKHQDTSGHLFMMMDEYLQQTMIPTIKAIQPKVESSSSSSASNANSKEPSSSAAA